MLGQARVEVIPNWTPVDGSFTAPAGKYQSRRLACLNTFDESKGHGTLLEAARLLKARGVAFELDLYGEGCLRDEMERRFRAAGLAGQVRFQGRTTGVHEVYDRSLCVLNPSYVESFGMTLIEALARKTPVIASRCGGPDDIVEEGRTGFLIERGDAAALADRIQQLLDSPELARRLGEQGFEHVGRRFSEQAAQAAFVPVVHDTVRSFAGYAPAVKTLAKIYRLWLLSPAAPDAERAAPPVPRASFFCRALRFAKRRVRQAFAAAGRALGDWTRQPAPPEGGVEKGEPGLVAGTGAARSSPISPHPSPLPEGEGKGRPTAPARPTGSRRPTHAASCVWTAQPSIACCPAAGTGPAWTCWSACGSRRPWAGSAWRSARRRGRSCARPAASWATCGTRTGWPSASRRSPMPRACRSTWSAVRRPTAGRADRDLPVPAAFGAAPADAVAARPPTAEAIALLQDLVRLMSKSVFVPRGVGIELRVVARTRRVRRIGHTACAGHNLCGSSCWRSWPPRSTAGPRSTAYGSRAPATLWPIRTIASAWRFFTAARRRAGPR